MIVFVPGPSIRELEVVGGAVAVVGWLWLGVSALLYLLGHVWRAIALYMGAPR